MLTIARAKMNTIRFLFRCHDCVLFRNVGGCCRRCLEDSSVVAWDEFFSWSSWCDDVKHVAKKKRRRTREKNLHHGDVSRENDEKHESLLSKKMVSNI